MYQTKKHHWTWCGTAWLNFQYRSYRLIWYEYVARYLATCMMFYISIQHDECFHNNERTGTCVSCCMFFISYAFVSAFKVYTCKSRPTTMLQTLWSQTREHERNTRAHLPLKNPLYILWKTLLATIMQGATLTAYWTRLSGCWLVNGVETMYRSGHLKYHLLSFHFKKKIIRSKQPMSVVFNLIFCSLRMMTCR